MTSASCGTEIALIRATVGKKIVGCQRNADGRTVFQLYIYDIWVIPYQFTKVLHMTLSELDEIRCVGSPGGHMCPKGISSLLLVWLPPKWRIKYSTFCYFAVPVTIQSIITWAIFIILKNDLRHFEAKRISFHLVYLTN